MIETAPHSGKLTMNIWFQVFISIALLAPNGGVILPADSITAEDIAAEDIVGTESLAFSCQVSEGVPTTVVQTPAATVPIVRWDSAVIAIATTPQTDCETSAGRFQAAYDEGLFSYLTTGRMDGHLVICTTDAVSGRCLSQLLDLRDTPKPRLALQRVLQIPLRTEGPISDTDCRAYVELDRYLAGGYSDNRDDLCPTNENNTPRRLRSVT
jgi:hypothetical protein